VFDGTTLLFGLPGVRVARVERWVDGTRVVYAVTDSETAATCPSRGVSSTSVKGQVATVHAPRRRPTPHPASTAPIPDLVHRLPDPRTAHPGRHHRYLVARDQRLRDHRHHQRPHRGLQPARQTSQTLRMRIPQHRKLGTPDTLPLHPQTAVRNTDFKLIARSKSKSPHSSPERNDEPAKEWGTQGHGQMRRGFVTSGDFLMATDRLSRMKPPLSANANSARPASP
jgi:hypothetical protein